jgi:hypothetical protein
MLWLPLQDVECVWTGPLIPVPNDPADPAWQQAMRECERQASAQAKRFQRLDPDARGGIRWRPEETTKMQTLESPDMNLTDEQLAAEMSEHGVIEVEE